MIIGIVNTPPLASEEKNDNLEPKQGIDHLGVEAHGAAKEHTKDNLPWWGMIRASVSWKVWTT